MHHLDVCLGLYPHHLKIQQIRLGWSTAIACLPDMGEAMSSISSTTKEKKRSGKLPQFGLPEK